MVKVQYVAVFLSLLALSNSGFATRIDVLNGCSYAISVCDRTIAYVVLTENVSCQALGGGSSRMKDLGNASNVQSIFWGYPGQNPDPAQGNSAKFQANIAEFCINCGSQDFYDLSNVVELSHLQPGHHRLYHQILAFGLSGSLMDLTVSNHVLI